MKNTVLDQEVTSSSTTDRLLKVIIALLLRRAEDEPLALRRQVEILNDLGMRPVDIADTLGRSSTYVNKELSGIRKSRKTA